MHHRRYDVSAVALRLASEGADSAGRQAGGGGKNGGDNGKMGMIRGHQASHDFWVAAKLQSAQGADNPRYAAASVMTS